MPFTSINLYSVFKTIFPERVPHVVKFRKAHKSSGIDIWFDDGFILNFNIDKKGNWILQKGGYNGDPS